MGFIQTFSFSYVIYLDHIHPYTFFSALHEPHSFSQIEFFWGSLFKNGFCVFHPLNFFKF